MTDSDWHSEFIDIPGGEEKDDDDGSGGDASTDGSSVENLASQIDPTPVRSSPPQEALHLHPRSEHVPDPDAGWAGDVTPVFDEPFYDHLGPFEPLDPLSTFYGSEIMTLDKDEGEMDDTVDPIALAEPGDTSKVRDQILITQPASGVSGTYAPASSGPGSASVMGMTLSDPTGEA
jgi:hypothetical protein